MSVIIWHQPAHELREVQEHLLRGGGWGGGLGREDARGPRRWFIRRVDKSSARWSRMCVTGSAGAGGGEPTGNEFWWFFFRNFTFWPYLILHSCLIPSLPVILACIPGGSPGVRMAEQGWEKDFRKFSPVHLGWIAGGLELGAIDPPWVTSNQDWKSCRHNLLNVHGN